MVGPSAEPGARRLCLQDRTTALPSATTFCISALSALGQFLSLPWGCGGVKTPKELLALPSKQK